MMHRTKPPLQGRWHEVPEGCVQAVSLRRDCRSEDNPPGALRRPPFKGGA